MKFKTPLCKLGYKCDTDKSSNIKHPYTPVYYDLFKDRISSVKKVFEIGIWKGASLRMWRVFFPNAQVYGLDVDKELMFEEERIKTFTGDSRDRELMKTLFLDEIGTDVDLVVDDGSHWPSYQAITCRNIKPLLKGVIYVIEDVQRPSELIKKLPEYTLEVVDIPKKYIDDGLVIVR